MTLNLKEFQILSTRTAPHQAAPGNHIEKQYLITNYVLGLNGEFIEFDLERTNIGLVEEVIKEAGDVLHYAVVLLETLGKKATDESVGLKIVTKQQTKKSLGDTLEITKKTYYHGHPFEEEKFIKAVKTVIDYIYGQLGEEHFYAALQMNIDKLKARYPDGFNKEDSIARVDIKS